MRHSPALAKFIEKPFVRFVLLGGVAAGVNWGSRFFWSLCMPFAWAVPVAYVTGMVVAFYLFKTYVFPKSGRGLHEQVVGFVLVILLGIVQVWIVSVVLAEWVLPWVGFPTFWAETVGHGVAILVPVFTSFIGHKHLSFRT